MKNTVKSLIAAGSVAATLGFAAAPAVASPEASAGAASLYLFRGLDLGEGNATLFGDLTYDLGGGASAAVWASSEGGDSGGEVDFILGWGGSFYGLDVGFGGVNYYYPGADDDTGTAGNDGTTGDSFGDFSEVYFTAGAGNVEFSAWKNVAGDIGYNYYTLGYSHGSLSLTYGMVDFEDSDAGVKEEKSYTHLDVNYAATDRLSFTVSKVLDRDYKLGSQSAKAIGPSEKAALDDLVADDDTLFVVSYTLPIDLK